MAKDYPRTSSIAKVAATKLAYCQEKKTMNSINLALAHFCHQSKLDSNVVYSDNKESYMFQRLASAIQGSRQICLQEDAEILSIVQIWIRVLKMHFEVNVLL